MRSDYRVSFPSDTPRGVEGSARFGYSRQRRKLSASNRVDDRFSLIRSDAAELGASAVEA